MILLLAGAAFALLCAAPFSASAGSTNVKNSVSVSASGDGSSHASVKTVIDGEVVEDIEMEGPGTLKSSTENGKTTVHTSTTTSNTIITDNTKRDQEIRELIAKLMELIQHYVSLLNTLS